MIFTATLNQMVFLFLLIAVGYFLAKKNFVPENAEKALSKLENYLFIPALVMGTFMTNFTQDKLLGAKNILIGSFIIEMLVIPVSIICVKLASKDKYIQNIYLYGLSFANFGFVGNAIVSKIFPDIFLEYLIFTLVLWIAIYLWGVPVLLMGDSDKKISIKARLKNFLNPMLICMVIGMVIGILNIPVPSFATNLVTSLGDCMSPIAMLLTGMTIARTRLSEILKHKSIYPITFLRLIVYPLIFIFMTKFIDMSETLKICALSSLAMPLGLNTVVIPAGLGKDTRVASGMALVSHFFACITIPIMFSLLSL